MGDARGRARRESTRRVRRPGPSHGRGYPRAAARGTPLRIRRIRRELARARFSQTTYYRFRRRRRRRRRRVGVGAREGRGRGRRRHVFGDRAGTPRERDECRGFRFRVWRRQIDVDAGRRGPRNLPGDARRRHLARRAFRRARRERGGARRARGVPHVRVSTRLPLRRAPAGVRGVGAVEGPMRAGSVPRRRGGGGSRTSGAAPARLLYRALLHLALRRGAGEVGAVGERAARRVPRRLLRRHGALPRRRAQAQLRADRARGAQAPGRARRARLRALPQAPGGERVRGAGVPRRAPPGGGHGVRGARPRVRQAHRRGGQEMQEERGV